MKKLKGRAMHVGAGLLALGLVMVSFTVSRSGNPDGEQAELVAESTATEEASSTASSTDVGDAFVIDVEARATGLGPDWDLPNIDHPRVAFWIERFQTDPDLNERFQGFLDRGGAWAPLILNQLEARGMPLDLLYLSMIESGFYPAATSRAAAVGLWQFLRATGEEYGLAVDRAVDERRDPVRSTEAGLTYLQRLHDRFGSWYLAAAAYNAGQNRIARIMRQQLGRERARSEQDYYRIWSHLPRETQNYIPLIIAAGRITKDPEAYGFRPISPEPKAWEEVTVAPATTLDAIARRFGTSVETIRELNPQLLINRTPNNREYTVRLPAGSLARAGVSGGGQSGPGD